MLKILGFVTAVMLMAPGIAFACFEPTAPSSPWVSEPDKPFCDPTLGECDQWQVDSYRDEVEDYVRQLQDFAEEAAAFAQEADEFAACLGNEAVDEFNTWMRTGY